MSIPDYDEILELIDREDAMEAEEEEEEKKISYTCYEQGD
jgi:hypothetical protein